jgi:hypothetical protein
MENMQSLVDIFHNLDVYEHGIISSVDNLTDAESDNTLQKATAADDNSGFAEVTFNVFAKGLSGGVLELDVTDAFTTVSTSTSSKALHPYSYKIATIVRADPSISFAYTLNHSSARKYAERCLDSTIKQPQTTSSLYQQQQCWDEFDNGKQIGLNITDDMFDASLSSNSKSVFHNRNIYGMSILFLFIFVCHFPPQSG